MPIKAQDFEKAAAVRNSEKQTHELERILNEWREQRDPSELNKTVPSLIGPIPRLWGIFAERLVNRRTPSRSRRKWKDLRALGSGGQLRNALAETRHIAAQARADLAKNAECRITLSALYFPEIAPIQMAKISERLLAPTSNFTRSLNSAAELHKICSDITHLQRIVFIAGIARNKISASFPRANKFLGIPLGTETKPGPPR